MSPGTGVRFTGVPVIPAGAAALTLSDLLVGRPGSGLSWEHAGEEVPLNPANAWTPAQLGTLRYSREGAVPGRRYTTRIELWATGKGRQPASVVAFEETATQAVEEVQRELAFRNLAPGTYRLVVRVTDQVTHQTVARERVLPIR
jgi:hypothetical protein